MKVSVIMTAYNVEKYIGQAIESILNQTHKDLELVLVDDCSTDGTLSVIESFEDDKILLVRNPKNLGCGMSRRIGIDASSGDYIITIDSDDWIDLDYIEKMVKNAEETGADIVCSGVTIYGKDGYWEKTNYGNVIHEGDDKVVKYWGNKIVFLNNKIVRRDIAMQHKYCVRRYIEDTPTVIPWLYLANKVSYIDGTGYHYRYNEQSLTRTRTALKHALYSLLCVLDLNDFFTANAPQMLKKVPLERMFQEEQAVLVASKPTMNDISKDMPAWLEYSMRMLLK